MPIVDVIDSHMAYTQTGAGDPPVVFLHGNPTSSHLWRDVIPHVATRTRAMAPDLIGMGDSGKPDIAYGFDDHTRYLDAWFEAAGLREAILVGHDWGGALALDFAARHPDRVRGVVLLETILKPLAAHELAPAAHARLIKFRTPGLGEHLVLEQNLLIETAFKGGVLHPLSDADTRPYRAPYPTPHSRRPLLAWSRLMPVDGQPADVAARVAAYDTWLASSTHVPKLLLTFDSSPTLLVTDQLIAWSREHIAALQIHHIGPAGHHAPEDQPHAIGTAIARWLEHHDLLPADAPCHPHAETSEPALADRE